MKYLPALVLAWMGAGTLLGQDTLSHPDLSSVESYTGAADAPKTPACLQDAFQQGQFSGQFRSFFMATDNAAHLSDYYAWAGGGALRFAGAPWHGFSFGVGAVFNFNLASSDLGARDSITGAVNRYEIGLFDVENRNNRSDFDRMEALWLRYQKNKFQLTVGRQSLQTPFINNQDGRMRPTAESGIWVEVKDWKNTSIQGGWLWKISPRSTVKWYSIGESIGLYPKGLNPDGTGSGYPQNLKSRGVALLGVSRQAGKHLRLQLWNQYVENIFNSVLIQADRKIPLKRGQFLTGGLQFIHQNALAEGGNADAEKTYFLKNGRSNAVSAQMGWGNGPWTALLAYTRVTDDGRFLSPREWGREPFYTFMSRERVEGSGDSHSASARVVYETEEKKWRLEAAYGHFYLPDINHAVLSKYAFPSFRQFNLDLRHQFGGTLKGLSAQLIYVWKGQLATGKIADKYVINKVNLSHYNAILNYNF